MRILLSAIYPYLFVLLFIILPFDDYIRIWPNILLIILAVIFPFVVKKKDFQRLKSAPVYLFSTFVIYLLFNGIIFNRFETDFHIIGKILLALVLILLYIPVNDIQKIKNAILFSSLAAIIYSVYNFVIITHNLGFFVLGDSPKVVEALLIDRIYLGLLSVLSILISFDGIKKTYNPLNSYYLGNIAINLAFIFLIASRISLIVLLVILIVRQFYSKKKISGILIGSLSVIVLAGFMSALIKNTNSNSSETTSSGIVTDFIAHSQTYELRSIVWKCAVDIAKNAQGVVTGLGFKQTEDRLMACYENNIPTEDKKELFISERYNTHNQFIDFYLSAGLIGILLFMAFLMSSLKMVRKDFFSTALITAFIAYMCFENIFHRQIGSYYVGVIIILALIASTEDSNKHITT